jgi:hypothetical protein
MLKFDRSLRHCAHCDYETDGNLSRHLKRVHGDSLLEDQEKEAEVVVLSSLKSEEEDGFVSGQQKQQHMRIVPYSLGNVFCCKFCNHK